MQLEKDFIESFPEIIGSSFVSLPTLSLKWTNDSWLQSNWTFIERSGLFLHNIPTRRISDYIMYIAHIQQEDFLGKLPGKYTYNNNKDLYPPPGSSNMNPLSSFILFCIFSWISSHKYIYRLIQINTIRIYKHVHRTWLANWEIMGNWNLTFTNKGSFGTISKGTSRLLAAMIWYQIIRSNPLWS